MWTVPSQVRQVKSQADDASNGFEYGGGKVAFGDTEEVDTCGFALQMFYGNVKRDFIYKFGIYGAWTAWYCSISQRN